MNPLTEAMAIAWTSKRVWLLQFLATPVLFALGTWWLTIPEAHIWQLGWSVILAVAVVVAALWLHAGTLVYFAHAQTARGAFRAAGRTLPLFAAWAVLLCTCLYLVDSRRDDIYQFAGYLRSILPLAGRRYVSDPAIQSAAALVLWVFFWIMVPGLLLPMGAQLARRGLRGLGAVGWRAWGRSVGARQYWAALIVLALVGVRVPQALVGWVPKMSTGSGETGSLVVRLLLAWSIAVTSWVMLASLVGRLGQDRGPVGR